MLNLAAVLLGLAALGGLALLSLRMRGGNPPLGLAMVHGTAAGIGLVLLASAVLPDGLEGPLALALGVLVLAALGGFALLAIHLRGKLLPLGLVVGHGLIAFVGYAILLYGLYG